MFDKKLRQELESYSEKYGAILVGLHNDVSKYKNEVKLHSEKTESLHKEVKLHSKKTESLHEKVSSLLDETKLLKFEIHSVKKSIEFQFQSVKNEKLIFDSELRKFNQELSEFRTSKSDIADFHREFSDKEAYTKRKMKSFQIQFVVLYVIVAILVLMVLSLLN